VRLLADEHVPPAFVSALRGEGHDVAVVGDKLVAGADDRTLLEYARDTDRVVLSEDTDFRGADEELATESHPGFLACDTAASPGAIATAARRIDTLSGDLANTVLFVPGEWVD
jgi:predicted nuclease of predicted toxin-antitoxin system